MKPNQKAPLASDPIFQVSQTVSKHTINIQESLFQNKVTLDHTEARFSVYP